MIKYLVFIFLLPGMAFADPEEIQTTTPPAATTTKTELSARNTVVRLGFETLELPNKESMGMLGGSYLFQLTPEIYAGPAVYGAVTGQRGGFFTGGAELDWRIPLISHFILDTGVYVGGGGGGSAAVGGGLMLRPHMDLSWKFTQATVGISVSEVRFPNGGISSKQVGVTLSMDDEFLYTSPSAIGRLVTTDKRGGLGFDRIALVGGIYQPKTGVTNTLGNTYASSIGYAGFRAEQLITPNVFWGIESGAAAKGGADGYAEILGLVGAETNVISDKIKLGTRVAFGMGGGGKVATGGGALTKAGIYTSVRLTKTSYVALEGGVVDAPNGQFKSTYGTLQLGMDLDIPPFLAEHGPEHGSDSNEHIIRGTEWSFDTQRYENAARYAGAPSNIDLIGLKIDRSITEDTYFSAQAHSAYRGGAGGFSVGLIGLGARAPIMDSRFSVGAEVLAGAAGGGGVSSQGGAVVQAVGNVGFDLTNTMRLKLGVGKIHSLRGELKSNVVDLSLSFPFGIPGR